MPINLSMRTSPLLRVNYFLTKILYHRGIGVLNNDIRESPDLGIYHMLIEKDSYVDYL